MARTKQTARKMGPSPRERAEHLFGPGIEAFRNAGPLKKDKKKRALGIKKQGHKGHQYFTNNPGQAGGAKRTYGPVIHKKAKVIRVLGQVAAKKRILKRLSSLKHGMTHKKVKSTGKKIKTLSEKAAKADIARSRKGNLALMASFKKKQKAIDKEIQSGNNLLFKKEKAKAMRLQAANTPAAKKRKAEATINRINKMVIKKQQAALKPAKKAKSALSSMKDDITELSTALGQTTEKLMKCEAEKATLVQGASDVK